MKKRYIIASIITGILLQLSHHIWLGSHGNRHFDFMIMLIILICGFLLSLKLTSYMADFREIKNNSRIEIIFLLIFFVLTILPSTHVSKETLSTNENRTLAIYKPLIKDNKLNTKYGKDFEEFFNDRFFLRNNYISFNYKIKSIFSSSYIETEKYVYYKKNNVVFSKVHIPKKTTFKKGLINKTCDAINELNDFCKTNNIKLYVLIVPYNQYIYQDMAKPFDNPEELKILNQNINTLISKSDAKIIYPFEELKEGSKTDWVYFKTDHHWTDLGAFIGYNSLMDEINKDFPYVNRVKKSDFNIKYNNLVRSDYGRNFHVGTQLSKGFPYLIENKESILDVKYKYLYHKNIKYLTEKFINNEYKKSRETYYPYGSNYKVLEMGTSMNENLLQFISYTFKNVRYLRLNNVKNRKKSEEFKLMKYYKNEILEYKPDIMILCITSSNLSRLKHLFDEE